MTRRQIGLAVAVAILGTAGAVLWWMSGDEPAPVDAEHAIGQERNAVVDADEDSAAPDEVMADLTGRWAVDTTRAVELASGHGTFVGYRVDEELANIGTATAIGRTADVAGHVEFSGTALVRGEVVADLTRLASDDDRRDGRVRSMLGPDATAAFVLDDMIDPGEVPAVGEIIELDVNGTLTIRDRAQPVGVRVQVGLSEGGLVVTGSTTILLEDFGVEVPSAAIVLSASDEATIEWQLFLVRQPQ